MHSPLHHQQNTHNGHKDRHRDRFEHDILPSGAWRFRGSTRPKQMPRSPQRHLYRAAAEPPRIPGIWVLLSSHSPLFFFFFFFFFFFLAGRIGIDSTERDPACLERARPGFFWLTQSTPARGPSCLLSSKLVPGAHNRPFWSGAAASVAVDQLTCNRPRKSRHPTR